MDGAIRQLTFRVQHDCPVAELSRHAGSLRVWSGHRFEVVAWSGRASQWSAFEAGAARLLHPVRQVRTAEGGFVVWHPDIAPDDSITRIIERHDLMWQQPMLVEDGWEHYDAISFGGGEQAALDELRRHHTTRVGRRRTLEPEDVAAALFLSLQPVLDAPTQKQAEALAAAHAEGYYHSPRGATTSDVARRLGIGRSAFEERLRSGENRIMAQVAPALAWRRGLGLEEPGPGHAAGSGARPPRDL